MEYEKLPFVLDPEEALQADAVEIREGGNLSPNGAGRREPETVRHGDVNAALTAVVAAVIRSPDFVMY